MNEAQRLKERAQEYLEAAEDSLKEGRLNVAYDEARTAAELAAKATLAGKTGSFPRDHNPAGKLFQEGLVPEGMNPKELSRLLGDHTRGTYGFQDPVEEEEVEDAVRTARKLLGAERG